MRKAKNTYLEEPIGILKTPHHMFEFFVGSLQGTDYVILRHTHGFCIGSDSENTSEARELGGEVEFEIYETLEDALKEVLRYVERFDISSHVLNNESCR